MTYERAALDIVVDRTEGYPYFLQQWGEIVWNEAEGSRITEDDVRAAEDFVNDELDRRFFRDRYEKATEAERIYMAAMADLGDQPRSSAEIADRLGKQQRQVSVRRDGLIKKGLIYLCRPLDYADQPVPRARKRRPGDGRRCCRSCGAGLSPTVGKTLARLREEEAVPRPRLDSVRLARRIRADDRALSSSASY